MIKRTNNLDILEVIVMSFDEQFDVNITCYLVSKGKIDLLIFKAFCFKIEKHSFISRTLQTNTGACVLFAHNELRNMPIEPSPKFDLERESSRSPSLFTLSSLSSQYIMSHRII